jgi:hypothetical protein
MDRHDDGSSSRSRARLAANLNALIERGATSATRLVEKKAITPSTLTRIRAGTHAAYIDHLDKLASALGVEPWQLLHPDVGIADLEPAWVTAWERLVPVLAPLDPSQLENAVALCAKALQPLIDQAEKIKSEASSAPDQIPPWGAARLDGRHVRPIATPTPPAKRARR